jgi:hypothetical protein
MGKSVHNNIKTPFTSNQIDIYIRILSQTIMHRYNTEKGIIHVISYNNFTYLHYWITTDKTSLTIDYRLSHSQDHIDIPHSAHRGIKSQSL